tara:strand:- start:18304 stop:18456 length:153 start_codon:yes stop_codon:yes gene_type:complete
MQTESFYSWTKLKKQITLEKPKQFAVIFDEGMWKYSRPFEYVKYFEKKEK